MPNFQHLELFLVNLGIFCVALVSKLFLGVHSNPLAQIPIIVLVGFPTIVRLLYLIPKMIFLVGFFRQHHPKKTQTHFPLEKAEGIMGFKEYFILVPGSAIAIGGLLILVEFLWFAVLPSINGITNHFLSGILYATGYFSFRLFFSFIETEYIETKS